MLGSTNIDIFSHLSLIHRQYAGFFNTVPSSAKHPQQGDGNGIGR